MTIDVVGYRPRPTKLGVLSVVVREAMAGWPWLLAAAAAAALSAAAVADVQAPAATGSAEHITSTTEPADQEVDEDLIYKVLVAEFAARNGQMALALEKFLEVARESGEPEAAERAVRIAVFLRDLDQGIEAAKIWSEADPESIEALQIQAALLLRSSRPEEATVVLRELVAKVEASSPGRGFRRVGETLAREKDKATAVSVMRALAADKPDDPEAQFALGQLLARHGEFPAASEIFKALVAKFPDNEEYVVVYAQILRRDGNPTLALEALTKGLAANPDAFNLRLTYARLLVDVERLDEAIVEFQKLIELDEANADIRFALSVLLMQTERLEDALVHLKRLEFDPQRRYTVNYYLGQILESKDDYEGALRHYGRVNRGEHRLSAQIRAAVVVAGQGDIDRARDRLQDLRADNSDESVRLYRAEAELLARNERLDEAMSVYNTALGEHDGDQDLLYARAMLAERLGDLERLEQDLRVILAKEPDNADALNALGYTLADRTDRFSEAHDLIVRAHELKPNDHYIIDSLGWVMYRLGRYEEAVAHLRRALELQADPEVAAHLGEVLWVMGDKDEAKQVWDNALEATPTTSGYLTSNGVSGSKAKRVLVQAKSMLAAIAAVGLLSACAGVSDDESALGNTAQGLWEQRLAALDSVQSWDADGRIGLTVPDESVTANVAWRHRGLGYQLDLSGPFGQGQARLSSQPGEVVLELADGTRMSAESANELVSQRLGWELPVDGMEHWMLGRPDPSGMPELLQWDSDGRPERIEQFGWGIDYTRFEEVDGVSLPTRLTMRRGDVRAKVLVTEWNLEAR